MKIQFESADKVNGLMTLTVEEADYKENVEKTLKDYRKKANIPGFRPGMVPMGLIKRQFGTSVKVDVINKALGEQIYKYVRENNIQMLGEPLPAENQEPVDIEGEAPYVFKFDVAVAPEFKIELNGKNKIDYYNIEVDDKLIDNQVDMFASRSGHYDKVEEYDAEKRDMLKGDLKELDADGNVKEDGIMVETALLMPQYIKEEDQKKLFDNAKLGSVITFNPRKAYPDNDSEIASLLKIDREKAKDVTSDFTYLVTEIQRFVKAEVNQELFDQVYGEGNVKSEEEFRSRIADEIRPQLQQNSDYKFMLDVRAYVEKKIGKLTWPDEILKRVMLHANEDNGMDYVEKNYEGSIKELTWQLAKEQLVAAHNVKLEDGDVKAVAIESARAQFAQYGMSNVPTEYLENYANDLLKKRENIDGFVDRAIENKLREALKKAVKLNEKEVTLDEFNAMMRG